MEQRVCGREMSQREGGNVTRTQWMGIETSQRRVPSVFTPTPFPLVWHFGAFGRFDVCGGFCLSVGNLGECLLAQECSRQLFRVIIAKRYE